ncbi:MAG: hypothetical protein DRG27_03550 [Deltaproteobacteria bacterium]|nr:MAG: hypothetical protein DRG27_03550 [Deltaproteobacteria bacterium]
MGTGKVALGSDIQRKQWMNDGLLTEASVSFWQPYTGRSSDSIVYQVNNESASTGHTVVFDYSGKLTGKAVKGDNMAYGKGEIKRKFSDKISVEEFTIPVDNGKKFDGVDIGDLTINEHSDSRSKLSDLFIRWKDQMIFDTMQGAYGTSPSHIIDLGTTLVYDDLLDIEDSAKTGKGMVKPTAAGVVGTVKAKRRGPLEFFKTENGDKLYLCIMDSYMAKTLKKSADYQTIVINADVRGNNNRSLSMVIGRLGKVIYVEAGDFFGLTEGTGNFQLEDSDIDYAGLRKYKKVTADGSLIWEGQDTYETATGDVYSRGLLLGGGAVQSAFGKMPDYLFQKSDNFGKTSQSAVEYWCNAKKTNLKVESGGDYGAAKVAELDYSIIAIDLKHV